MLSYIHHNLPNLISSLRILMAPLLFYLALNQQAMPFIAVLIFTEFTDVLDGYLARRMNLVSEIGSQLDSWGDFLVYTTITISAWLLWPDIILREKIYVGIVVASFVLPVIIGLIKFKKFTSYHTISVKISVAVSITAYILLFTGLLSWPVIVAAIFCFYAGMEQILITLVCKQKNAVDVKSLWHVLKERK